ncbi:MAG TPA: hypothetical protein VF331_20695 [Polyangiales bacterium]
MQRSWFMFIVSYAFCPLAACQDSSSVGHDPCVGAKTRCAAPRASLLTLSPLDEVTTENLPTLQPTWQKPLPAAAIGDSKLAVGASKALWLFSNQADGLGVRQLDADGKVIATSAVARPKGTPASPDPSKGAVLGFGRTTDSEYGPALTLAWNVGCTNGSQLDPKTRIDPCGQTEGLVFAKQVSAPPLRLEQLASNMVPSLQILRDAGNGLLFMGEPPFHMSRLSADHTPVWTQTELGGSHGTFRNELVTTLLPGGSVALCVPSTTVGAAELFRLDVDGNVTYRRALIAPQLQDVASTHDSQGDWVIVASDTNGDLELVRNHSDETRSAASRVNRESGGALSLGPVTVDAAGTVYVASSGDVTSSDAGSSEAGTPPQRSLLCRMPEVGAVECFTVPTPLSDIRATTAGVVYGIADKLVRFDLPK